MYFEGATKQACHYAENALCYRCFFGSLAKIYRTSILMNFGCVGTKIQWNNHPVMFFNTLVLVVTKGHNYLNKLGSRSRRFASVCTTFCYHQGKGLKGVLEIFKEPSHEIKSVLLAVFIERAVLKLGNSL